MGPKLHFLGTGSPEIIGERNAGGFLIKTNNVLILVDPGPGAAQALGKIKEVDALVITHDDRGHDAKLIRAKEKIGGKARIHGIEIIRRDAGYTFKLPDCVLTYITDTVNLRKIKDYSCDILVLSVHQQHEKLITKLKPRLAILTYFTLPMHKKNPLYLARELQQSTGVQTIAAHDGLTVDLYAYSALAEQKSLAKYQEP